MSEPSARDGAGKKPKTGGRVKKSLDQMLVETKVRSELAGLHDDTPVPAQLAAIYLGISEDKLLDLRKAKPNGEDRGTEGPPFSKVTLPGAVGQNQPVMYPLGGLKDYLRKHMGANSHEVALKSNMLGWVSDSQPFFAQPEARRRPMILIARAWDFDEPDREELFIRASSGDIRVIWAPAAQAVKERWQSVERHKALIEAWRLVVANETAAVQAALNGSELEAVAREPRRTRAA